MTIFLVLKGGLYNLDHVLNIVPGFMEPMYSDGIEHFSEMYNNSALQPAYLVEMAHGKKIVVSKSTTDYDRIEKLFKRAYEDIQG